MLQSVGNTTFEYDYKGRRTKKGTTEYYYDGDKLIAEIRPTGALYFFYDESGVCGMRYNGANYEFVRNIFGDVIAIYNQGGTCVATYSYDAWGNCTVAYDPEGIGVINPIRYRGYYYDIESGLYYLMSRYYDPFIGQFISMDTPDYLKPETIGGVDLYAYCGNNPVMYVDPTGHFWKTIWNWFVNTFGAGVTESQTYKSLEFSTFFGGMETGASTTKVVAGDISKPISVYAEKPADSNWWKFWEYKIGMQVNINDGGFNLAIGIGELNFGVSNGDSSWEIVVGLDKIGFTTKQGVNFANRTAEQYSHIYIRTIPTLLALAVVVGVVYLIIHIPVLAPVFI